MKKHLLFINFILVSILAQAQFSSPGTGVNWNMDSLVTYSDGIVTGAEGNYVITDSITIALTDTLEITEDVIVEIAPDVLITVFGAFYSQPEISATYTVSESANYKGFRFEEGSAIVLSRSTFEYGGGLQVLTETFIMDNCIVQHNNSGISSSSAVGLYRGNPIISNTQFIENEMAAIGSGANGNVGARVEFCTFEGNTTGNENRPQINLGPSGTDTTFILNNEVIGNPELIEVGGISVSSFFGVETHTVIQGNFVENNRYGIAVNGGNIYSQIIGNTIIDNNTQGLPFQGGSGINLLNTGDNLHYVSDNYISGNLWGITLQNNAMINLGDTTAENYNPGGNVFSDNGNGGQVYALFNNTPNEVMAMNNCWIEGEEELTAEEVENVISHFADDENLGVVNYTPFSCDIAIGIKESENNFISNIYPNPATELVKIKTSKPAENLRVFDLTGREVLAKNISGESGEIEININNLPSGIYLLQIEDKNSIGVKKFIKK